MVPAGSLALNGMTAVIVANARISFAETDHLKLLYITADQSSTKGTMHTDTKLFVLQDSIKEQHISLEESLRTQYKNIGDQFVRAIGRIKSL